MATVYIVIFIIAFFIAFVLIFGNSCKIERLTREILVLRHKIKELNGEDDPDYEEMEEEYIEE